MATITYRKYLKTDHWRELRALKLSENPRCEYCNSIDSLEVHHRLYRKSWYDARLSDLRTLCHSCHGRHHAINGDPNTAAALERLEFAERPTPITPFDHPKNHRKHGSDLSNSTAKAEKRVLDRKNLRLEARAIPNGKSFSEWLVENAHRL